MASPDDFIVPNINVEHNAANGWPDLEPKEKAFAYEYLANGFNHGDAADHIGIPRSSGLRTLRKPIVAAFIDHLQQNHIQTTLITKHFVEAQYLKVLPMLMGEVEVPMVDKHGEEFDARKFHSSEVTSVLRDLARTSGYMDAPDLKVSGFEDLADAIKAMTEANTLGQ